MNQTGSWEGVLIVYAHRSLCCVDTTGRFYGFHDLSCIIEGWSGYSTSGKFSASSLVAITLPFEGLPRLAQLALAYRSRHQEQLHPLPELAPCSKPSIDHHCFTASYGFGLAVRAATVLDVAAE